MESSPRSPESGEVREEAANRAKYPDGTGRETRQAQQFSQTSLPSLRGVGHWPLISDPPSRG